MSEKPSDEEIVKEDHGEPSQAVADKALDYISEGKVKVISVVPPEVIAYGSGDKPYRVRWRDGMWQCSCPARVLKCAHAVAADWIAITDKDAAPPPTTEISHERNTEIDALLGLES